MTTNTWMPILVRQQHYTQVAQFIADLEANHPGNTNLTDMTVNTSAGNAEHRGDLDAFDRPLWTVDDLKRLANGDTITTQRWTAALDLCAQTPGVFLPSSTIAQATGMDIEDWRSATRQITRHLAKHYPNVPPGNDGEGHVWPLKSYLNHPEYPGQVSWSISPEMADLWRQARQS